MTKSGRKRKKADKAKVQLKKGTGKKSLRLPKGLNVTDSRVTTTKISIANQLKAPSPNDGPLTKKKIGMKDLLSKLNSMSSSIRIDGLDGLMELIKNDDSAILEDHLSLLLNKIAPMATDRESKIRKLANSIFSTIVKQVDVLQVEPLFPMLSAHLCCGLSHIDTYIQRDSLKHLDEILNFLPGLIAKNFQLILPNCLNQISMQQNTGAGGISTDKARTLSANVDEKISSLQWRKEVLQRVQKLFEIVIQTNDDTNSGLEQKRCDVQMSVDDYYMGLYDSNFFNFNENLGMNDLQNIYYNGNLNVQQKDDKSNLDKNYAKSLVPLLLDTWSEALLSSGVAVKTTKWNKNAPAQNQIRGDIGPILEAVVKTLHLLVRHFKKTSIDLDDVSQIGAFQVEYEPRIVKQMVDNFPYELLRTAAKSERSKGDKKTKDVDNDGTGDAVVCQINLSVVRLYLDLSSGEPNLELTTRILQYLKELFEMVPTNVTVSQICEILTKLFESRIPETCSDRIDQLMSALMIYHSNNPKLVELLGSLSVRSNGKQLESVEKWIEKLPEILSTKNGSSKHRQVVKHLLKQRNESLLKVLPKNFDYFLLMKEA